jgi:hypothetical protein
VRRGYTSIDATAARDAFQPQCGVLSLSVASLLPMNTPPLSTQLVLLVSLMSSVYV